MGILVRVQIDTTTVKTNAEVFLHKLGDASQDPAMPLLETYLRSLYPTVKRPEYPCALLL